MTSSKPIDGIISSFQQGYAAAYREYLETKTTPQEAAIILNDLQRAQMEREYLDKIVPNDPEVLIDLIIAQPELFSEEMPTRGLFDVSPANLVRYNIMARAKVSVGEILRDLEAELFKDLTAEKFHAAIKEAVDMLRAVKGMSLRAEIVAANGSLNQFLEERDQYSLDNLLTDALSLVPLLQAVEFDSKVKELEEITQYVSSNRNKLLTP
jgi:hypothetical protein